MMAFFYLAPAKGDVPIHLLEEIIRNRLEYMQTTLREGTLIYNEYVVEGSVHDNVGHFILCILSGLLNSTEFTHFLINAEITIFKQRIMSLSAYDLRCFAKKLLRIIRKSEVTTEFMQPLQILCRHLLLKSVAMHVCSSSHNLDCTSYSLSLYFKHCLPFISRRKVHLANGFASVPCGIWKQYLVILFKQSLLLQISKPQIHVLRNDPRIIELLTIVKNKILLVSNNLEIKMLKSNDVDTYSQFFPPCMLNLHQQLRDKHRLSHNQRFYYSLFLKDIGMPVDEATVFWKSEYSLIPNGTHKCTHNWEKDEKKFIYGIRHMYGLEGGKKNYGSANCQRIQNQNYLCHEGGCPFKSFDTSKMLQILQLNVTEPLVSQIFDLQRRKLYSSACLTYLQRNLKTEIDCDKLSEDFAPVKYFMLALED